MNKTITLEEYAKNRARRNGALKKYGITILFLLPFLAAFIVFFIVPLFYGFYISVTNFKYNQPGEETYNYFEWYKILFTGKSITFPERVASNLSLSFKLAFIHTLMFALIMVPIAIILPLALAILVNIKPPLYKLFRSLIYMPSIVPLTAAGTIFTMMFLSPNQNGLLYSLFGIETAWFNDSWFDFTIFGIKVDVPYAWVPIFFMCLWGGWGGNFIILSAGLQNVPKHLYEACEIDGCSEWKKIMSVTIPGIKPQLVLCLFTTIIGYLGLYGQNFVLTGGGPAIAEISRLPGGGQTSTIMYYIQDIVANNTLYKASAYGLGAAASLVFALFTGIISGIQMYLTREKKTGTKISEAYYKWQKIR